MAFICFGGQILGSMREPLLVLLASGTYLSVIPAFASVLSIHLEAKLAMIPTLTLALSAPLMQEHSDTM
jgi:hypothetical protein